MHLKYCICIFLAAVLKQSRKYQQYCAIVTDLDVADDPRYLHGCANCDTHHHQAPVRKYVLQCISNVKLQKKAFLFPVSQVRDKRRFVKDRVQNHNDETE